MGFPAHIVRAGKTYVNGVEVKHTHPPAKKTTAVKPGVAAPKKQVARESMTSEPATAISFNGYDRPNGSTAFKVF